MDKLVKEWIYKAENNFVRGKQFIFQTVNKGKPVFKNHKILPENPLK